MARLNTKTERYRNITEIALYEAATTSPYASTTSALLAKAAATISPVAFAGLANNDDIFINGSGGLELNHVAGVPASSTPLKYKAEFAQPIGAEIIKVRKMVLGYPTRDGASFSGSLSNTAIESAIDSAPIGFIPGVAEMSLNFALYGWNIENLQLMYGAPEVVTGTGTASDPFQGSVVGANIGTAGIRVLRITGTRADLKTWHIDFLDFSHEVSGSAQLGKEAASYPIAGKYNGMIKRIYT